MIKEVFEDNSKCSLFHYTGIGALLGIDQSKSLWASSIYYLNDGAEIVFAKNKFLKLVEERLKKETGDLNEFLHDLKNWLKAFDNGMFNIFVFSLSENQNQLSQWRSYTPHGKGVSIEFTPQIVKGIAIKNNLSIARCRYEHSEHLKLLERLLSSIIESFLSEKDSIDISKSPPNSKYSMYLEKYRSDVLKYFSVIKHPAFSEEREWRLVSEYFPSYVIPEIKYREGASMLVPYMEFALERFHDVPQHTHPVYFASVHLGPSQHANMSMQALHQFLSNKKISHVTNNSTIPYREW